jgi:glycosyltransferase involved in cell wall biosynthesis
MISLCITNLNRIELLVESFEKVLKDERIGEIIISDDHSDPKIYSTLQAIISCLPEKVKMFRNDETLGVYANKRRSVELAKNHWCIVFDSDNIIDSSYIDTLYKYYPWDPKVLYQPDFGKDEFNWTRFAGQIITSDNISKFLRKEKFSSLINAMNCFVNKEEYLKTYEEGVSPIAADSIYKNYLWLKAGNRIFVVPGLQYVHRVHKGSHYIENAVRSNEFFNKVDQLLKQL